MVDKLMGDYEVDKALLWKYACVNKKGKYLGEDLTQSVKRIVQFIKEKEDGVLVRDNPKSDILYQALEKPDHPGRVRGVGGYLVSPSSLFGGTKGHLDSQTQQLRVELHTTNEKLAASEEKMARMQASLERIEAQMQFRDEQRASCSTTKTASAMCRCPHEVSSTPKKLPMDGKSHLTRMTKASNAQLPQELR